MNPVVFQVLRAVGIAVITTLAGLAVNWMRNHDRQEPFDSDDDNYF